MAVELVPTPEGAAAAAEEEATAVSSSPSQQMRQAVAAMTNLSHRALRA